MAKVKNILRALKNWALKFLRIGTCERCGRVSLLIFRESNASGKLERLCGVCFKRVMSW